jgi:uncharacterized protein
MQQDPAVADCETQLIETAAMLGGRVAVAVRGGIDSLTLATFLHREAISDVTMFHAVSPAVPGEATVRVERLAADQGWALRVIDAGEFNDADYRANPVNRCFFCKTNLYGSIARHTDAQILSGANLDDLGEYRPGLDASRYHGVRHPYLEARVGKMEVRALARRLGLGDLSELPAAPCLSSRVETGLAIRPEMLKAIHSVERSLAADFPHGTIRCRVRATGVVVELDPATLAAVDGTREAAVRAEVSALFADAAAGRDLLFAPYRNGSAFLRDQP